MNEGVSKKTEMLEKLKTSVLDCKGCELHMRRKNLVFGNGNPESSLVFIGEAPGREEDEQGLPFVGEAGKLLTELLKSVGISRKDVYITNVIKCRPPNNRDPLADEITKCYEWLNKQIDILSPKIICTLGRYATYSLIGQLQYGTPFSVVRNKLHQYKGATVIPTFHPAALLYRPKWKEDTIRDLKLVKKLWKR